MISPVSVFSILWRRKVSLVVTMVILSVLFGWVIHNLSTAYSATALVLIQDLKSPVTDFQTTGGQTTDSVVVRTQADILKSPELAGIVVRKLKLDEMPEFSAGTSGNTIKALLGPIAKWDPTGAIDSLGLLKPVVERTSEERLEVATALLLGATSIVNDGKSYVIEIKVKLAANSVAGQERTARLCALIANTYAETYTQFTGKVKADTIRQANGFFDERIAVLRSQVALADRAVQDYRLAHNLIEDRAASGDSRSITVTSQQLSQLNTELVAASTDRVSKESSLAQITDALNGRGNLQAVTEIVGSGLIARLREQQTELSSKEAGLAMSRGNFSPDLVAVRAAERAVTAQIAAEAGKIASSLRGGVEAARAREASLRSRMASVQSQVGVEGVSEIHLRELQNEAEVARSIYSTYLKKAAETSQHLDMMEPDALVVSHARLPLGPMPPSKKQLTMFGVVAAAVLSTVLALARERAAGGLRTAAQLVGATGIEVLGYVPKVRRPANALAFTKRDSQFSEAILSIRALLWLPKPGRQSKAGTVVMVTSALPREGKTFCSVALARNAALAGERVILVDCSIRQPAVAKAINATGVERVDGVTIRRDTLSPLEIITLPSDTRSPPDLFASSQMRDLMTMLRYRYGLIVLDAPPVLAVSDTRVLAGLCDTILLVVRWRATTQAIVSQAARVLRGTGPELSAVINRTDLSQMSQSESASVAFGLQTA